IAAVGVLIALASSQDDGDPSGVLAPLPSTSTSTTIATTTTSTTPPHPEDDDLTAQVRAAVEAAHPGDGELITDTNGNLLGNLKIDTTLGNGRDSVPTAVRICQTGQQVGYVDVAVRSRNGHDLVSTGIFDNTCRRR